MASELKRGAIRILSNYARLFIFLVLGIFFVRIVIGGIGEDAFGLIGLLGASIGFAEMCKEIIRSSMNRELGAAFHNDDPEAFPNAYNAAMVISAGLAVVTALFFLLLFLVLPLLTISEQLRDAAAWMILAKGIGSVVVVLLGPQFNMYLVSERMIWYNVWSTSDRVSEFLAAFVLFVILGVSDPSTGLIAFGFMSAGLATLLLLIAVAVIIYQDRRLVPDLSRISRREIRRIIGTTGWNGLVVTAVSLHIRADQFIMNVPFGEYGNAIFTLAVRLTGYVRMVATGITGGLDVVSARLSTAAKQSMTVLDLIQHATRLHAIVALPSGLMVFVLAAPLLTLWVGRHVENPQTIADATVLTQIMVFGMTARAISDCWMRILYGAGHIRAYAPMIVLGGLTNPVLAVLLIYLLPAHISFTGPTIAFAVVFTVVHFFLLPHIVARVMSVRARDVFQPILRPLVITMISGSALFLPRATPKPDSILLLLASLVIYGILVSSLTWFFALTGPERRRLIQAALRQLNRDAKRPETQGTVD